MYYYPGPFYSFMLGAWGMPVAYPWGFYGAPWYGYYGAYWAPWGVYPSPAFWLTDFLISNTLQAAYEARIESRLAAAEARDASDSAAPMSAEVKEAIPPR